MWGGPVILRQRNESDCSDTSDCFRAGTLSVVSSESCFMGSTVHEIRNAIRVVTGRFDRELEAAFTKEELQAICEVLEVDTSERGRLSSTRMRRLIRA